ncbi:uncharacterized protein EI97DRAFT_464648 [Westerdykella ornata]|uniref:Ubiquitin 3 binding protein But2 C-terminal domain-containing protein n=1 Tax=Westerdykella ornata TaxID=318751 RepID=A0A6A6JTC1_WESOR|nr:uncharacterized protein EI97DRAFT_464648 [Westerdykella ornata]KAF2279363.1 hypothetical protein EI97DRAFT_464648 [Westerdykella ornata]
MKTTILLSIFTAVAVALPALSTKEPSLSNSIIARAPKEAQARISNVKLSGNGCSFPDPENTLPILTNDPSKDYHNFTLAFYKNTMVAKSTPEKSTKVECRAALDLHLHEDWKVTINKRWVARGTTDGLNGNLINAVSIGDKKSLVRVRLSPGGPKKGDFGMSAGGNEGVTGYGGTSPLAVTIDVSLEIFASQSGALNLEAVDNFFEYSKKD